MQASLKLVLEPIFEADFHPCSYGFRPKRRAQDAIEEIRHFARLTYEWVLEGDISSCFDKMLRIGLLARVRDQRRGQARHQVLVKAFLIAGILRLDAMKARLGQGGIVYAAARRHSLSVLDQEPLARLVENDVAPKTADGADAAGNRCIASCATRMTSWCWCPVPSRPRRWRG